MRARLFADTLDVFLRASSWQMYTNACLALNMSQASLTEKLRLMIGKARLFVNVLTDKFHYFQLLT